MKKLSTAVLALALLASTPAMATTRTATLTLRGTIAEVCILNVQATGNATNLDLTTTQSRVVVGTVSTRCNNPNGYNLSVDTRNGSTLDAGNEITPIGYKMALVQTVGTEINSGGFFPSDSDNLDIKNIRSVTIQQARISLYTTTIARYAGTYTDTLTFTLTTL